MADKQTENKKAKGGAPKGDAPKAPKAAKPAAKKDGGEAPKAKVPRERSDYVARLRTHYEKVVRAQMTEKFGYKNPMQVPVITKVVLNMGIGEGVADRKKVDNASQDLSLIAGQKSVITKARMYDFLDRLVNIALPRIRDFRGLNPKSFDGRGNYSLGIKEHIVFPEID